MKIFIYTLMALVVALIAFNATLIDFEKPFEGNSFTALIGMVLSLCAICILIIFKISKNIEEKTRQ